MKAPKKLYLSDFTDTTESVFYVKRDNTKKTDIEYTRTDAFIEEVCQKLEKCMYDNLMFQGRLHRKEVIETFIEDFYDDLCHDDVGRVNEFCTEEHRGALRERCTLCCGRLCQVGRSA